MAVTCIVLFGLSLEIAIENNDRIRFSSALVLPKPPAPLSLAMAQGTWGKNGISCAILLPFGTITGGCQAFIMILMIPV